MFQRIGYTWNAMGASWDVLKKDKELLIFPVISGFCLLLVLASFAIPIYLTDTWQPPQRDAPPAQQIAYYGVLFLFYFCNYFVITFFNSAIVGAAVMRLSGQDPSLGDALNAATHRLPQILAWSLVAATVGFILRIIEDRSEKVGAIVSAILGAVWSVTTFLVIPVLVVEGKGPVDAFTRSAGLLKKTWGDQLVGNFSFGIIFFLLSLPAFALIAAGVLGGNTTVAVIAIAVAAVYLILLGLVQSVLQSVFQAVLYVYTAQGREPKAFGHDMLQGAMGHR